jgi:hypothetical protein
MSFQLQSNYKPRGDQAQAIAKLIKSVEAATVHQTLLGVTGSGKTFTIANVIQELDRPTLVISHNKTLAAQLYSEFKQFFPRNAVEYFVSYFDYYQPEAYIPRSDTYIEKDSPSMKRSSACGWQRRAHCFRAATQLCSQRLLHLRHHFAGRLFTDAAHRETWPAYLTRSRARPLDRHVVRAQRCSTSRAADFAYAVTSWKSILAPLMKKASGSNFSATKLRRLRGLIL